MYRQLLVQGALAILLPTEDLQNTCLRTLVSDIIADLILGQGISSKACEGWFLHETCIKIVELIRSRIEPETREMEQNHDTRSRLQKFGLLSPKGGESSPHLSGNNQSPTLALFWRLLHNAFLFFLCIRFVVAGLFRARSLPSRGYSSLSTPSTPIATKRKSPSTPSRSWSNLTSPLPRPILEYHLFALLSTLLEMSTRMPWLTGSLSLCKHGILTRSNRPVAADSLLEK